MDYDIMYYYNLNYIIMSESKKGNPEKVQRNKQVIADRKAGMTWEQIAKKNGLYNGVYAKKIHDTYVTKYSN